MGKAPAFQFYPGDWLSSESVLSMTPAEEGAYIHLLAIAWMTDDCGLPDDDKALAVLSRLGEHWFNGAGTVVRQKFFSKGERLFNKRLLEERKKQAERVKLCSAAGVSSGKARNYTKLERERTFNERSTNVERNMNSSSSSSSSPAKKEKDGVMVTPLLVPGGSGDDSVDCPHEAIISAYHEILPSLPTVKVWNAMQRKLLRARWKEEVERQTVEWWRGFFTYVSESSWLMGQNDKGWAADLEWLVRPSNFAKIANGRYHRGHSKQISDKTARSVINLKSWLDGKNHDG